MLVVYIGEIITVVLVAILWANGIAKMKDNYPDYKGKDFLDWDENKQHTEGQL